MQPNLFYTVDSVSSIPLYLVSPKKWAEQSANLTSIEYNYFRQMQFNGNIDDCCLFYNADGLLEKAFIGTGNEDQTLAMAHAAQLLPANTYQVQGTYSAEAALYWALAQYQFDKYKENRTQPRIMVIDPPMFDELLLSAQTHFLVRDLINEPASDLGPEELADAVAAMARKYDAKFEQWIGNELLRDNFPAIHAVGRAAQSEPRLLSLIWGEEKNPRITLVGKGVCFDTGGLNIKSPYGMRIMKKDMGGAAHVIGLAYWIMASNLPIRLHLLIPTVENAIGPCACRPGDILTMRNGFTVELDNTDAEGRLIMADALVKACEEYPDLLIDFATLSSSARVAVGTEMSAFFTNNETLSEALMSTSVKAFDPLWRLPLFAPYEQLLQSSIADMVNCSDYPYAGAIVAALFLQRYITPSTPWLHFDIMAWSEQNKPGKPEGGEVMGLRAVMGYLLDTYGS
ncbi:leucyl aminopeptidase family protein [Fluoribacter dumoffii]|uniref:Peptidase B n=1 Tax=Fluoribacter dumoffii TaxID=463 RepID=A0A377GDF0_9GAMM|nr:leucyl aminopeptidase family protein [Fluoribacter dumoffii]KTC91088.1 aminopeptidase [Fluoribacter dumoffii NY 23]MCW8416698.1 leucyl aminopeptidase family protein [Fluoribacter dumoffii]MCW8455462.1 leucyl aminopeptidase family protein [Fluoribacter dumoffii]MCW8460460.1 leucyl aminopeptidase family protein [Fluoribacter dumoffii]MCW8483940.1 leucyl aminopeptidase family protein [Fluoribacter dumoffii]